MWLTEMVKLLLDGPTFGNSMFQFVDYVAWSELTKDKGALDIYYHLVV